MTTKEPNLFYDFSENISILMHTKSAPTDPEWFAYLGAMRSWKINALPRVVVLTDGGGPTPTQRQLLQQALGGRPYLGAVIGESAATRFIVAALALSNPQIRTFFPGEIQQAYAHLQLSVAQQTQLVARLSQLSQQADAQRVTTLQKLVRSLAP